jgi:hypothetical protein
VTVSRRTSRSSRQCPWPGLGLPTRGAVLRCKRERQDTGKEPLERGPAAVKVREPITELAGG